MSTERLERCYFLLPIISVSCAARAARTGEVSGGPWREGSHIAQRSATLTLQCRLPGAVARAERITVAVAVGHRHSRPGVGATDNHMLSVRAT